MGKEKDNISIEYLDELEEDELEGNEFKPEKPKLTQFIPILLFCCLFIFLGTDFIVRTEIKEKWENIESIHAPFTAIYLSPLHDMDSCDLQNIEKKIDAKECFQTKIYATNDSVIHQFSGNKTLISDRWTLEPLLYKHRADPLIKGLPVKNKDEKFYDILLLKWERVKILFLTE